MKIAAPLPVKIRDVEYMIAPLTFRDMISFERYAQRQIFEIANAITDEERKQALQDVAAMGYYSDAVQNYASTIDGAMYHVWLGLKNGEKKITLRDFEAILVGDGKDPRDRQRGFDDLMKAKHVQLEVDYPSDPKATPAASGDQSKHTAAGAGSDSVGDVVRGSTEAAAGGSSGHAAG